MADSKLKIYYFDGKGRIEAARIILVAAGKEFEDIRFPEEDWPKHKHIAPFGQCPLLEIDGQIFAQSLAIKTYLAREFGFYGQTNLESLKIDQLMQLIEDLINLILKDLLIEDEVERNKAAARIRAEVSPRFLGYFEKLLKENGTGYFVANRLTLADIAMLDVVTGMLENYVDVNDNYPLLQKNVETVKSHDKIGPYLAARKVTPW